MDTLLLQTKLYIPPPRPASSVVLRSHLIKRLNQGLQRKLILISAPAGFGKTTLVREWLSTDEDRLKDKSSQTRIFIPRPSVLQSRPALDGENF